MKALLALAMLFSVAAARSDIIPSDPDTPLFQIYEIIQDPPAPGQDPHTHHARTGQMLLEVHSLAGLQKSPDGTQAFLNGADAKKFSQITHQHSLLLLLAGDKKTSVAMRITGPIDDGIITLGPANFGEDVAKYLHHRFNQKQGNQENADPQP